MALARPRPPCRPPLVRPPRLARRAGPAGPLAVALGGAVLVAAAATVTRRPKAPPQRLERAEPRSPELPPTLTDALKDFEGDFTGPWLALGLEVDGLDLTAEEIRLAYRQAVRREHPDASAAPDAEADIDSNTWRKAMKHIGKQGKTTEIYENP